MASSPLSVDVIRFGQYEANLRSRELRREGASVRLPDQSFEVLVMLLERPGELVTREEIVARLWDKNTFLDTDQSINSAIRKIRAALKDDPERPRAHDPAEPQPTRRPMSNNANTNANPPARTHGEAAALFRRPFAPGAIGFRAMMKVRFNGDPFGGAQVAAYIGAQSVLQRLNAVLPGRWRMDSSQSTRRLVRSGCTWPAG